MTELLSGIETPSDAELISRVRGGDTAAYGELFARHVEAARRLGRQLARGADADDLVSDAFAKTLHVLQSGGGPDVAFRAYLLTSVRRLHVDRIRAARRVQPSEDMSLYDDGEPFHDTAVASFENGAAARAFSSLPERWQLVLWHLEVEGQKPADIAPLLGMSANSVSALAYRAREGLRQAFLTMHLADCATEQCRWVNEHLGGYVRKGLSRRDTAKVEEHLEGCRRCTAMYLELDEVNSNLAAIIGPLLLGAAAAGYLSSSGAVGLTGVSAFFGRVRDSLTSQSGGAGSAAGTGTATGGAATGAGAAATGTAVTTGGLVAAGGVVAAGVAAVATAALVLGGGGAKEVVVEANRPGITATPPGDSPADEGARTGATRQGDEQSAPAPSSGTTDAVVVATIEPTTGEDATTVETPPAEVPVQPLDSGENADGGTSGGGDTGGDSGGDSGSDPGSGVPVLPPIDLPDPLPDTPPINLPVPPPVVPPAPAPSQDDAGEGSGDPADAPAPGTGGSAGQDTGDVGSGDAAPGHTGPGNPGSGTGTGTGTGDSGTGGSPTGDGAGSGGGSTQPGSGTGGAPDGSGTGGSDTSGGTPGAGSDAGHDGSPQGGDTPTGDVGDFHVVGAPVVTAAGSDDKGSDRHRYTVALSFAGVRGGDVLTLRLVGDQARFCDDADCSQRSGDDSTRKVTVHLAGGSSVFAYAFDVRLPGSSTASLEVSLGGRSQVVELQR